MLLPIKMESSDNLNGTKSIFISAFHFATSLGETSLPFGDELKAAAQEQIEYMLSEDGDTQLITSDSEVKTAVKKGLLNIRSLFETNLSSLLTEPNLASHRMEDVIVQNLNDLDWLCNILPKMGLMKDFVSTWTDMSSSILGMMEDKKLDSIIWGSKLKLIKVTGKVLDAVGYGTVILPAPCRLSLLKMWLPYIRKMKPLLDSKGVEVVGFPYTMDEDLCQNIEEAIVSYILALPSNDQAEILADWLSRAEQVMFPDLTDAFELWCFRNKSAKRRLVEGS